MLILYEFGNSVACQKVRLALCEKGLKWESRPVDLFRSEQYEPEYLKLNPQGLVPVLVHEGRPIVESTLINEYIDEVFPVPRLMPADVYERVRMRLWSKTVDEGLQEGVSEISFSAMFRDRLKGMPEKLRGARFRNIGDPRRRDRCVAAYELGVESPYVQWAIAAFERAFDSIDHTLGRRGNWLAGDAFSLAEISLMPYLARLEYLNLLDIWIGNRPGVLGWWARCKGRASFGAAIADPLTQQERDEMDVSGTRIRARVRELRATLKSVANEPTA
ncbi:MAG: hypothetical protein AMJ66_02485 [Betaproteobacteria bacterium SG8_40]|nr:MAG: hypothetical protein AMJ66_02485 [Betaproteobacteria bacterium SG8_40]